MSQVVILTIIVKHFQDFELIDFKNYKFSFSMNKIKKAASKLFVELVKAFHINVKDQCYFGVP